jgi:hypothetical protein
MNNDGGFFIKKTPTLFIVHYSLFILLHLASLHFLASDKGYMHTNEQKIIKLSMMVLSLAIILVYVLLFQVKGKTLKGNTPSTTTS